MAKQEPTFIKAAIEDWKCGRISTGRLFGILRVPFRSAYTTLLDEEQRTGKLYELPTERIQELLMTKELLMESAKQGLRELKLKGIKRRWCRFLFALSYSWWSFRFMLRSRKEV